MPNLLTTQEVIKDFKKIHGDKYNYSKVIYKDARTPVNIICKKHKTFPQTPTSHKSGRGCPDCYLESKIIDLTNKRFGKLTVLRKASLSDKQSRGKRMRGVWWLVQCSCGTEPYFVRSRDLRVTRKGRNSNTFKSCKKCSMRDAGIKKRRNFFEKLKDNKYGLLTVLRDWGSNKQQQRFILCNCECGGQTIVLARSLSDGNTTSCGCFQNHSESYYLFKKNSSYANENCYVYLADLDNYFIKVGITNNLEERKRLGKYRSYEFSSQVITRCEAWVIEQIILRESLNSKPKKIPKLYINMNGKTEIRERKGQPIYFYQNRYQELLEELASKGWEDVYLSRFNI